MTISNSKNIICPVSSMQQQFWLLNQLQPDSSAYNIPSVFCIRGNLNISALEKSINKIISRHEIFRTVFAVNNSEIIQIISPEIYLSIVVENIDDQQENEFNTIIEQKINDEVRLPFNLFQGPLIRVKVLSLSENNYILLILMHHIIIDLRTKDLFVNELSDIYSVYIDKSSFFPDDPRTQYSQYALWQKNRLNSEVYNNSCAYWKKQLGGKNDFLDLPVDKQRPSIQSFNGTAQKIHIPKSLTKELKEFSRKNRVNIYLTLLTAYAILLFRYTRQTDITIGVPLTNRRHDDYKNTMGCFINILPIFINLEDNPTFCECLRRIRIAMLGAHRNQEIPFESIVNELQPKRDDSYNPLFQTGFTFEHPMKLKLYELDVTSLATHSGGSQLDLFAIFWERQDGIHGFFEYNTDLFSSHTINRIINNYIKLLNSSLTAADQTISTLPFLSETEQKQIIVDWNKTETEFPPTCCVHELFEKQVNQSPAAIAIIFEEKHLTYLELNQKANQLANYLCEAGIKVNDLVGIFMERSLEMVVALLGILKAGGIYVPIDPEFPEKRISYMIKHSQVSILLTQDHLKTELPECKASIIPIDTNWKTIGNNSKKNPVIKTGPDNLAYVIYTSGSTGKPKGVQVQHSAVVNFLFSMSQKPGLNSKDTLLAVTTLSFDISVLEIFLPLAVGAKTVIADRNTVLDGTLLLKAIYRYNVNVLQATPVTWRLLIEAGWKGNNNFKVLCGGEALSKDLAAKLTNISSNVWNMYGPTETTVWSACNKLSTNDKIIHVGKPVANTKTYILDENMLPVPIGVSGELYIGGAGVTQGYYKQIELTAVQFISNPFSTDSDEKLYKTGDIARYHYNGNIEILGRSDFQLKIRGYRIEPGEIETVLNTHPAIEQAVIIAHEYAPGDQRLIAYYVSNKVQPPIMPALDKYLIDKLPKYMIPSIFIFVETMPLTPNGKINRKALPEPDYKRPEIVQKYVSPKSELEKSISEIWCKVLKFDRVGIHDRFFEIGGDSFLAMQVIGHIEKKLDKNISILKLFQFPTISALSEFLENGKNETLLFEKAQNRAKLRKRTLHKIQKERKK